MSLSGERTKFVNSKHVHFLELRARFISLERKCHATSFHPNTIHGNLKWASECEKRAFQQGTKAPGCVKLFSDWRGANRELNGCCWPGAHRKCFPPKAKWVHNCCFWLAHELCISKQSNFCRIANLEFLALNLETFREMSHEERNSSKVWFLHQHYQLETLGEIFLAFILLSWKSTASLQLWFTAEFYPWSGCTTTAQPASTLPSHFRPRLQKLRVLCVSVAYLEYLTLSRVRLFSYLSGYCYREGLRGSTVFDTNHFKAVLTFCRHQQDNMATFLVLWDHWRATHDWTQDEIEPSCITGVSPNSQRFAQQMDLDLIVNWWDGHLRPKCITQCGHFHAGKGLNWEFLEPLCFALQVWCINFPKANQDTKVLLCQLGNAKLESSVTFVKISIDFTFVKRRYNCSVGSLTREPCNSSTGTVNGTRNPCFIIRDNLLLASPARPLSFTPLRLSSLVDKPHPPQSISASDRFTNRSSGVRCGKAQPKSPNKRVPSPSPQHTSSCWTLCEAWMFSKRTEPNIWWPSWCYGTNTTQVAWRTLLFVRRTFHWDVLDGES